MCIKKRIVEICELGEPQSIIQRAEEPITELIKTDSLIEELNEQLSSEILSFQSKLLLERLDRLGNMLYEKCGTDSYEARCYLHDTKELIKKG